METGTLKELNVKPGDVVECVQWEGVYLTPGRSYTLLDNGYLPDNKGEDFIPAGHNSGNFRLISRAADPEPKLWGDMTPEEKGALLLARHEGKVIQYESHGWHDCDMAPPGWFDGDAYRVRPEPKRETVVLYAGDTPIGTIDLIDGKPDPDSIRMDQV